MVKLESNVHLVQKEIRIICFHKEKMYRNQLIFPLRTVQLKAPNSFFFFFTDCESWRVCYQFMIFANSGLGV